MDAWYHDDLANFPNVPKSFIGFHVIVAGVLALLLTPILTNEAIPYYLLRGKEAKALKRFAKLKSERKPRVKTVQQFEEFKAMVEEDVQNGNGILSGGNFTPLYIVLNTRLLHLAMSCVPLLMLLMHEVGLWDPKKYWTIDSGFLTELTIARLIVGIIVVALASCCDRHKFIYIVTILISVSFLVAFLQNMHLSWAGRHTLRDILGYSVPVAHTLIVFGVDYCQMKQSVEAFSVTKKAWSLAIVAIIEHSAHAGLIALFIHHLEEVKVLIASAIIILSFLAVYIVPNTRNLSLRATRNLFSGYGYV